MMIWGKEPKSMSWDASLTHGPGTEADSVRWNLQGQDVWGRTHFPASSLDELLGGFKLVLTCFYFQPYYHIWDDDDDDDDDDAQMTNQYVQVEPKSHEGWQRSEQMERTSGAKEDWTTEPREMRYFGELISELISKRIRATMLDNWRSCQSLGILTVHPICGG